MRFALLLCLFFSPLAHGAEKGLGMWYYPGSKAQEVAAVWYYNWTPYANEAEMSFVPMIWGEKNLNMNDLNAATQAFSKELLGFNEPDGCDPGSQACMGADRAVQAWPQLMATGKRLGSPAVAGNYAWLDRFMAGVKARNYRVDFLAVHHYPDLSNVAHAVSETLGIIDNLHSKYQMPIWLTEFGTLYGQPLARTKQFIDALIPQLDARPYVERYAWFSDHSYRGQSGSAVFDDDGTISAIGEAYRDITTAKECHATRR